MIATVLTLSAVLFVEEPTLRDFPVDPVALLAGREVAGDPAHTVERHGFRYSFVDAGSRAKFLSAPENHEVQLGGACARMGALSGAGDPSIWTVHDGHIYVFASESCREGFRTAPDRVLDAPDPRPHSTRKQSQGARAALSRAAQAHGVDGSRWTLIETAERDVVNQGKDWHVVERWTFGPDGSRSETAWNDEAWSREVTGSEGFFVAGEERRPMVPAQVDVHRREALHHPLVVLRERRDPNLVALVVRPVEIDGRQATRVVVHLDGATTELAIDMETGRVVRTSYRGRGPDAYLGKIEKRWSDHAEHEGLWVAERVATTFEGKPWEDASGALTVTVER